MPAYVAYIGYAASFFVLLSFLMKNIVTLRTVNIVGCGLFIVYGLLIESAPIIITNVAIVLVNGFYLWRFFSKKEPV